MTQPLLTEQSISRNLQYSYALRITTREAEQYVPFLNKHAHTWAFGEEVSEKDKDHIHCFILSSVKKNTLKQYFIKDFPNMKGNGHHSWKDSFNEKNSDFKHLCYVCKDKKVTFSNICPNLIETCKNEGSKIKEKSKEKKEVKKNSKYSTILQNYKNSEYDKTRLGCLSFCVDYYLESTVFNDDHVFKLFNYIYGNFDSSKAYRNEIISRVANKYPVKLYLDEY